MIPNNHGGLYILHKYPEKNLNNIMDNSEQPTNIYIATISGQYYIQRTHNDVVVSIQYLLWGTRCGDTHLSYLYWIIRLSCYWYQLFYWIPCLSTPVSNLNTWWWFNNTIVALWHTKSWSHQYEVSMFRPGQPFPTLLRNGDSSSTLIILSHTYYCR